MVDEFNFDDHREKAISEYNEVRPSYSEFATKVKEILEISLRTKNIPYYHIDARAKELESFGDKAVKPSGSDQTKPKYAHPIKDIEDMAGVRVITLLEQHVGDVCKCIEQQFKVETREDKSKKLIKEGKFGYKSIHYIIKLLPERAALIEYTKFENLKLEIQVRTILQHAWAEIEHDIQYKSKFTIENNQLTERKFYRLASLLELADQEFQLLHDEDKKLLKQEQEEYKDKIDLDQVINQFNLGAYLRKVFPDRNPSEPKYVLEIVDELIKENCKYIKDVDALVKNYSIDRYILPQESEFGGRLADVGVIRSLLVARKIDEIKEVIDSWRPLPLAPKELRDCNPFVGSKKSRIESYLMKSNDDIIIYAANVGKLEISFEELGDRIGTGLPYLRHLMKRLEPFHEYLVAKANDV